MFAKVLVANRGAIACRIMRTLRAMGVRSVAVYSEADVASLHVRVADEAYLIGPGPAADSYLRGDLLVALAKRVGAEAIHPGYGFLSENAAFVEQCQAAGIVFIGPRAEQIRTFGLKHTARALAEQLGVPLLPGSGLLSTLEEAYTHAKRIGYPVMLKSTAGGGGIGMRLVHEAAALEPAFTAVQRLAGTHFRDAGLYLEHYVAEARHIEVQIFGDGLGQVVALGERDCSIQRRHQKVIEESPALALPSAQRLAMAEHAVALAKAVQYLSAGTVEFVYDRARQEAYFLEVNTRLQVEHGVTEAVLGIDLVQWMVLAAAGEVVPFAALPSAPVGAAIEVRLYAEDAAQQFQPSTGVITELLWPAQVRIETWIEKGTPVGAYYDPMLAKLIVHGASRQEARARLIAALAATRIDGIQTNLAYLAQVVESDAFEQGALTTAYLAAHPYRPSTIEVLEGGLQTSLQDWPGRLGYWSVGVPPSGPMDALAHRLANALVGNAPSAVALECTMAGPSLRFRADAVIAVTGAAVRITLDQRPIAMGCSIAVREGSVLSIGRIEGPGCRAYLAIGGGIDVPAYLGSRATFTLGQFGGHAGRCLRVGDVLPMAQAGAGQAGVRLPLDLQPTFRTHWDIGVLYGPHGAPDFFLPRDITEFFASDWQVHYNSSRTGIRLIGPKPQWARRDGGEAGLHPSNIHDNAYAIGSIDFTGDMPVILGPDGPSLGGFVCPAVVAHAELWKLGQLRAGDRVRFHRMSLATAMARDAAIEQCIARLQGPLPEAPFDDLTSAATPILAQRDATAHTPRVLYRQAGDRYVLIEYGPLVLDLELRLRVHALMTALQDLNVYGLVEMTPGMRSLQVRYEPALLPRSSLLQILGEVESELPAVDDMDVPSRVVYLPLAWDDAQTRLAIDKYMQSVRQDAPWCPSNIEFIRRINGLPSIEAVRELFFAASYLVLGLGDVYLGAPVATPVDPRHRLVTTKYNPARTWTPENAVGIGGAYLCIYGMEGPGGYQFLGRTVQMWNRWRHGPGASPEFSEPWLLRLFDQLRFYPVSEAELERLRIEFPLGRAPLRIEPTRFRLAEYRAFLQREAGAIDRFKAMQQSAFEAERERWRDADRDAHLEGSQVQGTEDASVHALADPPGASPRTDEVTLADAMAVHAPVQGSIWKVLVQSGDRIDAGDVLLVIESMKMEFPVLAPQAGQVLRLESAAGHAVAAGQRLLQIKPSEVSPSP